MADEEKKDGAALRVKDALKALATFARIREELFLMRTTCRLGEQRERLEDSIRLNQDTMNETRKILSRAEDDLLTEIGKMRTDIPQSNTGSMPARAACYDAKVSS